MKNLSIIMSILLLVGCHTEQPRSFITTLMVDCTEEEGYRPKPEEVRTHAELPDKISAKYFSIVVINESKHNQRHGVLITKAETGVFYDELTRNAVLDDYQKNIDTLIQKVDTMHFGSLRSQIFEAVLEEVRFQVEQDYQERTIILYSDLMENSGVFSLNNKTHKKLLTDPEQFKQHFEEQFQIKEDETFEGIHLKIYHLPMPDQEEAFDAFLKLYQDIFQTRGAIVTHETSTITKVEP